MHEGPEVGMRDGGGEGCEEARGGAPEEGRQVRQRRGVDPRCEAAVHLRWGSGVRVYMGTLLRRNRHPVGPYSRTMLRLLWLS